MRVDGVAPRTWLLGALAGWALVVWVLALAGLGGHLQPLPDDSGMLARLPQLPPAPPERLGPPSQYAEIGARPLFSEDRRPQPFFLTAEGDADAAPTFDYVLTSVLITPTVQMAIVQPSAGGESVRIKLGEAAEAQPAYRLTALNPRSAVFEGPDGQHNLDLRIFDGSGGEPPTATAADNTGGPATVKRLVPVSKPTPPAARPVAPAPPAAPAAGPAEAADAADAADAPNTEAQIEGIRKRIEERRAQLRQQAQNPPAPAPNP